MNVFGLHIEFNSDVFDNTVFTLIKKRGKGYVCVIDANVLTMSRRDRNYQNVINAAYVNTCDGSSIASMVNIIYKTHYKAYNGPEIFGKYIEKPIRQLLLGNTQEKYNMIKTVLRDKNVDDTYLSYLPLPFMGVDDFNYEEIARQINQIQADIIWVSLGAPKQEIFMNKILPYIDKGVMFGIGAAFNFYIGELNCPKIHIGSLRFIWLDRLYREPKKIWRRLFNYLRILPGLYLTEIKRKRKK